jgi:hypothetical protein
MQVLIHLENAAVADAMFDYAKNMDLISLHTFSSTIRKYYLLTANLTVHMVLIGHTLLVMYIHTSRISKSKALDMSCFILDGTPSILLL